MVFFVSLLISLLILSKPYFISKLYSEIINMYNKMSNIVDLKKI